MHMHGFTILLGYGLGPFVCSEQIVYICFLIIIRHQIVILLHVFDAIYLRTHAFIMIEVSKI